MRSHPILFVAVIIALGAAYVSGQTPTKLAASGFQGVDGNLFYRLSGDGATLLASRSPNGLKEELVTVPTAGGPETVWHAATGRWIYNRIALSADARTVAFARSPGSVVYVLTKPEATPRVIANVAPDSDPRDLRISGDGKWVAFTASRMVLAGADARVHANLYVAATDGSVVHQITTSPLPERHIAFDLSSDAAWIAWVDDPAKGPSITALGSATATRVVVALAKDRITDVAWNVDATKLYYHTFGPNGVTIRRVQRNGAGAETLHSAAHGRYEVARASGHIRLSQFDPQAVPAGTSWRVGGAGLTAMYQYGRPDVSGTTAWNADGAVCVWRAPDANGRYGTWIWRSDP